MSTGSETAVVEKPAPTKLYVALHKARTSMSVVAKGAENKFDKYKYATLADYLEAIQKPLDENGLIVVSHIDEINWLQDRETKGGGFEKVCRIMLRTTVIHAESGEQMSVTVLGEGQDRSDKAFYKADTGARKYAIANLFNLATDDDPETGSSEGGNGQQRTQQQNARPAQPSQPTPPVDDEAKQKQAMIKGWPVENIVTLIDRADTIELLDFVIDGAEDGTSWEVIESREKIMQAVRERYKHIITNTPANKRNSAVEDAFKTKMVKHKEKLQLDKEFEEMQQKMERDDVQTQSTETLAAT